MPLRARGGLHLRREAERNDLGLDASPWQALLTEAGLPEGVCNVITGYGPEVGAPMTNDPDIDMISFYRLDGRGPRRCGGRRRNAQESFDGARRQDPQLIFPDADMDAALDAATFGAYFNAGECCNAGSRLLLHADIAEEFLAGLAERAASVKVGDPLDPETKVGAIISSDHLGKIEQPRRKPPGVGMELACVWEELGLHQADFFMAPTIVEERYKFDGDR